MLKKKSIDHETIAIALANKTQKQELNQDKYEQQRSCVAHRISSRILRSAARGNTSIDVKGGPLGLRRTEYSSDVYMEVAQRLDEYGVAIAIHG